MEEQEIISHFFEIERQAYELIEEAQTEYNKRIDDFRSQAEAKFKEAYAQIIKEEENRYKSETAAFDLSNREAFEAYCSELRSWPQDKKAFNEYLEQILFAE